MKLPRKPTVLTVLVELAMAPVGLFILAVVLPTFAGMMAFVGTIKLFRGSKAAWLTYRRRRRQPG